MSSKRIHKKAPKAVRTIQCACGCGQTLKNKDKYGRTKRYINGHNNRKYDDPTQYKREWNHRNRKKRREYKKTFLRNKKIEFIKALGEECSICGTKYNGDNAAIFDFHHREPKKKEFNINMGTLNKLALFKLKEELKKCALVCSNCHRLIHNPHY